MKAATNKVGISSLAPTFINDKEIPLLCMLGWFILHSFDINEKMNLELVDAQNF
jgi:hypothetical protein